MRSAPLLLLLAPSSVLAATLQVGPTRTYTSIQDAIDDASAGDTIEVDASTYAEALTIGKNLTITGMDGAASTSVTLGTLESGAVVTISGASVTFEGFTVEGGGMGFDIEDATVDLSDVYVSDNESTFDDGVGLYAHDGSIVTITDSTFDGNATSVGAGGHIYVDNADVTVTDTAFTEGSAGTTGGAIHVTATGTLEVSSCTFEDNSASSSGGALYLSDGTTVTVEDSTFAENSATLSGGAIYVAETLSTSLELTDVTFRRNAASNTGPALSVLGGSVVSTSSSFSQHSSSSGAGAVHLAGRASWDGVGDTASDNSAAGNGGVFGLTEQSEVVLSMAELTANSARNGGAVATSSSGSLTVEDSWIGQNSATASGGGVYASGSGAVGLVRNTACVNTASSDGGAVYLSSIDSLEMTNNALIENRASSDGGGLFLSGSGMEVVNNTFVGNDATDGGAATFESGGFSFVNNLVAWTAGGAAIAADANAASSASITYGLFYDNADGNLGSRLSSAGLDSTNLTSDPELTAYSLNGDCTDDELWPVWGSPVIDAGDPALADPDGSVADIGAYGGPSAEPSLFEDADGDDSIVMFDCDEADATTYPDAEEYCDGVDHDCDGLVDEDDSVDAPTWYADLDEDGYGDAESATTACEMPDGFVEDGEDCDDGDAEVWPGAPESCDVSVDMNCDGSLGNQDQDNDGALGCVDCDDGDESLHPDADEVCDGIDNDCDDEVDEEPETFGTTFYADLDGDGYGDPEAELASCEEPTGYVTNAEDCDDADADSNPEGTDIPDDGIDQDCDGSDAIGEDDEKVDEDETEEEGSGCGCSTPGAPMGATGLLAGLLALVGTRRRRG